MRNHLKRNKFLHVCRSCILRIMTTDSKNRKWPSTDERIGLVVPPLLKKRAMERARQERLPLQVFVRLAIEKQLQESTIAA